MQSKGLSGSSPTPQFKSINSSVLSFLYSLTLTSIHDYWKTIALTRWTFVDKVMSLLFNMLSRLVITFLPRSKHLLILWLQSPSAVILEPPKIKPATVQSSNAITLGWISLQVLMCIRKVAWNERQVSTICGTPPHSSTK